MTTFNERLIKLHRGSDMSQDATVAAIKRVTGVSITQGTFSNYMRSTEPDVTALRAIANFYGVSTAWLTGETDDRRPLKHIMAQLADLSFSPDVVAAAKILAQMPEDERAEICAMIAARYRQFETMQNLIKVVELFDHDGAISRRVKELSGFDLGKASGDFVSDDLFGDSNLNGTGEQLALIN